MKYFVKNIIELFACYIYLIFRGCSINQNIGDIKKIIVIPASKLGDLICTTPVFHALKSANKNIVLTVCADKLYRKLLEYNSDIDEFLDWNDKSFIKNIRLLRSVKADAVVITSPYFFASACCYLAGIKTILAHRVIGGYSPFQTRSYRAILPLLSIVPHEMGKYAPREYLRLLEPIGVNINDTKKHLAFSSTARTNILEFFKKSDVIIGNDFIIGISVTAGNKIKEWGIKKFADLANWIYREHKALIIFTGAKNDQSKIQETIDLLDKNIRYINVAGKFDFDELKALISMMNMFISVDSGPIYIAEAFGVPTVDITGPIDEKEQPPIGKLHKVVHILDRKGPELYVMNARSYNKEEAKRQTDEINVDMVIKSVNELFHEIKIN